MLTVVIPTLKANLELDLTLSTLLNRHSVKVVLVIPQIEAFKKYQKYGNILLLQQTGQGIYSAFNDGLKVSKSKFVMFAGAGDVIFLDFVLEQLRRNPSLECIMGNVQSDQRIRRARPVQKKIVNLDKITSSHSVGMVFATEVHKNVGLYNLDFKICADYDLILRMLVMGFNVELTDSMFGYWPTGGFSSKIHGIEKAREHRKIKLVNLQTVWYINVSFVINVIDFILIQKIKNYFKKMIGR